MNLKLLIAILLFCGIKSYASGFKTFVPKEDGYVPVAIKVEKKSINNICKFLGYNSEEFYTYNDFDLKNSKIFIVIFKSFSDKIICVLTEDTVESIEQKDVDNYLVNFNLKDDFDSYDVESTLEDGVKNKSLSKEFLSEVFNNPISDNDSFVAVEIGYELHFKNGVLTSYNPSDGLNKWAKSWKNEMPERYRKYYNEASRYQTNETDILKELNAQAAAFANTPDGVMNEYIKFHTNDNGIVNYKMLLVAHYNQTMDIDEFKLINKGRYELSNEFNDQDNYKRTTYRVNKGLYTFDEKGKLINSYTSN
ncbi:hypothetical protein ACOCEA_12005 [Maribacter sp. CXY002]|uniref:hypothetical protein n=1 Tax=Maribacter luteocoastalis TaxID=3407671 RepID=UPI003B66B3CF